jgi:hypothetical protein
MGKLLISLSGTSEALRSRLAQDLSEEFSSVKELRNSELLHEKPGTQDAGTIISIILAGPAVLAAVRALRAWAVRNNLSSVVISKADGTKITLDNLDSGDVGPAVEALKGIIAKS